MDSRGADGQHSRRKFLLIFSACRASIGSGGEPIKLNLISREFARFFVFFVLRNPVKEFETTF